MTGWTGKILRVDLTAGQWSVETPDEDVYHRYIGGRGLAGHLLSRELGDDAALAWDAPAMPVLLMAGPLVGTSSPTSGRMTIATRSPLTGAVGDCSVGGDFGTYLKRAGWDGIIFTGRASTATGIEINDGQITLTNASGLIGLDTREAAAGLKNKGAVALTGPAADAGVLFASVIVDSKHAAGRCGIGAAWAAKQLKYITVAGSGKVSVTDPAGLKSAREDIFRLIASAPVLLGEHGLANYGTGALYDLMDARRMMPTDNFRRTFFAHASQMNAGAYQRKYKPKRVGCRGCHILCKKATADGRHLPEFETMSHFSALLGNKDIETVMAANELCSQMGMDTISAGATLACYSEIQGRQLTPEQIIAMLVDIGRGLGEGKALGQGSYRYGEAMGRIETSMTVKKQELPGYDPRGAYGMALAYATSTRGGCHLRAYPISHEILRKPVATDRFSFSGKARIIKIAEDANAMIDSLTACKFVFFAASLEEFAKALTAVTAMETSAQDLLTIGERICYNERILNAANGFTAIDDDLPARFFTEAGTSGNNIEVPPLDRAEFLAARASYYKVRGLDATGMPTAAKAKELGLSCSD